MPNIPGVFVNGQLTPSAALNITQPILPEETLISQAQATFASQSQFHNSEDSIAQSQSADSVAYSSASAGQPSSATGIFTASTSTFSLPNAISNQVGASTQAINNATSSILGTLPGSLAGIDAGLGALSFSDVSKTNGSTTTNAKPNILHSYKNYTYRLSLSMLDSGAYNTAVQNPAGYTPTNVLIASGGIYGSNTFVRNQFFADDFYFESAQLHTIIGANADTRGSNVINIKFDIIEPTGCTLLNRLMDATQQLNGMNYLEVPYILQVDFVGYDDNGNPVNPIPGTTKIIPIKLAAMKFNISSKGSEYKFEAFPYNHTAFDETTANMPVNFEITATTIADLFSSTSKSDWTKQYSQNKQREDTNQAANTQRIQQLGNPATDRQIQAYVDANNSQTSGSNGASSQTYKVPGIADALNSWYKYLEINNQIEHADQFAFVFDDDIATSTISLPERTDIKNTQYLKAGEKDWKAQGAKSSIDQGVYAVDYSKNAYRINAGTTVIDLINTLLRNSEYLKNQLISPYEDTTTSTGTSGGGTPAATTSANTKSLFYWKIVPEIKLLDYDKKRNRYARKITYHVKKFSMSNVRYKYAPQGKAKSYVKDYQYLFTGQNMDIVNLDLNFEALFYTAVSSFPSKHQDVSSQTTVDPSSKIASDSSLLAKSGLPFPDRMQPVSTMMSSLSVGNSTRDVKSVLAADLTTNILAQPQADMLQVDLTIIGDPDFIKQDDIFFVDSSNNPNLNGSIPMDTGEVYVRLMFKSGVDYDPGTGLLRTPTSNGYYPGQNVFSGLYKVIQVISNFVGGKFEQSLTMIRLANQPDYDYVSPSSSSSSTAAERSITGSEQINPSTITNLGSGLFSGGGVSSIDNSVTDAFNNSALVQSYKPNTAFHVPTVDDGPVNGSPEQLNVLVIQGQNDTPQP